MEPWRDVLAGILVDLWGLVTSGLVHGTLLAGITLLLSLTLLKRARPALLAALWTIVLAKFAVPVGPEVPVSLDAAARAVLGGDVVPAQATFATGGPSPAATEPGAAASAGLTSSSDLWLGAQVALIGLYAFCVIWLLRRRFRRYRGARAYAGALPRADRATSTRVAEAARVLGLRRAPETRVDAADGSPRVVGAFRPILVVPRWLVARPNALEAILIHELAHLRRRDTWMRFAQLLVGTLFFFWPVVAWVNRRIDCAREMACDQWAVMHGKLGALGYARLLLALAKRASRAELGGEPLVALLPRPRQLERRIDELVSPRARDRCLEPRLGLVTGLAVGLWGLVSLGGAARADATPEQPGYEECVIDPSLVDHILTDYPEADTDGDGELTRAEICAHQERMKRQVVDDAFDAMDPDMAQDVASWLDPTADTDGDGVLSEGELEALKGMVATSMKPEDLGLDPVEFPGQVCEEAPVSCTESIEPAIR